jgi:hypothetical protein
MVAQVPKAENDYAKCIKCIATFTKLFNNASNEHVEGENLWKPSLSDRNQLR